MSFLKLKAEIQELGMSVRKTGFGQELEVKKMKASNVGWYFTDDEDDAYGTAWQEGVWFRENSQGA